MRTMHTINLPSGCKAKIPTETYHAIKRAVPILHDDCRVIAYAAGLHEGITAEIVSSIRRRMISNGELPARAFSRRVRQND